MKRFCLQLFLSFVLLCSFNITQAETLVLGHSTWVGYGPFYIARDKGYFEEEGVEVKLQVMENTSLKMGALMAGKIDAVASTADEFPLYMKPGSLVKYIFAVDNSKGGDGVVARKEFEAIADLKGKQVAFEEGSVSQFFINALLREAGLTQDDINMVNMTATDAGVAFTANRVDAAVTWEPHLSQGAATSHGKLLVTSAEKPGLIVDVVAVTQETWDSRRAELEALWRGWNRALAFLQQNPDEAYAIMAKGVGGWLEDPKEFAATVTGIEYLDEAKNRELFGQPNSPGQLYQTLSYALDIWRDFGRLQVDVTGADIIEHSIVGN
ncbi:MAG: ABC transporter substrate-binding protein [Proteobacteria bacterium]|nr:ABC transporter substrate-binding protein [Pseudomonadota bacterium]